MQARQILRTRGEQRRESAQGETGDVHPEIDGELFGELQTRLLEHRDLPHEVLVDRKPRKEGARVGMEEQALVVFQDSDQRFERCLLRGEHGRQRAYRLLAHRIRYEAGARPRARAVASSRSIAAATRCPSTT